ncbi:MAG: amino acid permease [Brockia lithotrophica]|nr:amino acid permease [Brockia lithotrophica]
MLTSSAVLLVALLLAFTLVMGFLAVHRGVTYQKGGRTYVGFVGVSAIAMMDLLASVFYGPGEAYRYIGYDAMFFLVLTSGIIALYAFSMTEIAEILEGLGHRGGGVYTITYLVFGRTLSLIAVASILVDYINMAALSAISAVENAASVFPIWEGFKIPLELGIVWFLALLNILGIRSNVWTTFGVFLFLGYALVAGIALGLTGLDARATEVLVRGFRDPVVHLTGSGVLGALGYATVGVGSTILAYSGIETVLQTQKLVENWREIRKAYIFLVVLNGILIPGVGVLALAHVPDPGAHVEGLVVTYAVQVGGEAYGVVMALAAALALAFAMNTAFVGGTELLTAIAERYGLAFLLRTNRAGVHQGIVLFLAASFTVLILITNGSANLVADMFAIGLLASFVLNLLALVTYRISEGYSRMRAYRTGVAKNVFLVLVFAAAFVYVAAHKVHGTALWAGTSLVMIVLGMLAARFFRNPDLAYESSFHTVEELERYIEKMGGDTVHLHFARPRESVGREPGHVYVTFALQRLRPPRRRGENHFVLPYSQMWGVVAEMEALLRHLEKRFPDKAFVVHLGWPLSSWRERLSTGFMVHHFLMLPRSFPNIAFRIEYTPRRKSQT